MSTYSLNLTRSQHMALTSLVGERMKDNPCFTDCSVEPEVITTAADLFQLILGSPPQPPIGALQQLYDKFREASRNFASQGELDRIENQFWEALQKYDHSAKRITSEALLTVFRDEKKHDLPIEKLTKKERANVLGRKRPDVLLRWIEYLCETVRAADQKAAIDSVRLNEIAMHLWQKILEYDRLRERFETVLGEKFPADAHTER